MAANGISTLPTKEERKSAKIALAEIKRGTIGPMYREYNIYIGTVSPTPHRPWGLVASPPIDGGNASTTVWESYIDGDFAASIQQLEIFNGGYAI
jgi:hypothetical protein